MEITKEEEIKTISEDLARLNKRQLQLIEVQENDVLPRVKTNNRIAMTALFVSVASLLITGYLYYQVKNKSETAYKNATIKTQNLKQGK